MSGTEFENQAQLQPLPLGVHAEEKTSRNKDIVNRMSARVKMLSDGKTRQVFLDVLKVLAETLSQCAPSFADVDGWATAIEDTVDVWLVKALLMTRALEVSVGGNLKTCTLTGVRAWEMFPPDDKVGWHQDVSEVQFYRGDRHLAVAVEKVLWCPCRPTRW